ncbi:hypothetical protein [Lentzea sp. NPDC003310]|uniref:hypothetical protein n=1 Tax=Lentzea sp. NPDC003310 TaxID=3154447 RepID=UPI00339EC1A5
MPSNFTFTFGGTRYAIAADLPPGAGTPPMSTTTSTITTSPGGSAWASYTTCATDAQVTHGGATYWCRQTE